MTAPWYKSKINEHLHANDTYLRAEPNIPLINGKLAEIMRKHNKPKKDLDKLIVRNPVLPAFYAMPKLHKTPVAIRPIVPNINWVTTNTSIFRTRGTFSVRATA